MSYQLTGKLIARYDTQTFDSGFTKREFVVETADNPLYPQKIKLEFVKDKCSLLDTFKKDQIVTVDFNLNGRDWPNKSGETVFFNTLQAWRISAAEDQAAPQPVPVAEVVSNTAGDDDDLPF